MNYTYDIHLLKDKNSNLNNYYRSDDLENSIEYLQNFNQINIFVGANNSGKSRFMRSLMVEKEFKVIKESIELKENLKRYNVLVEEFDFSIEINQKIIEELKYQDRAGVLNFETITNDLIEFTPFQLNRGIEYYSSILKLNINIYKLIKVIYLTILGHDRSFLVNLFRAQGKSDLEYFSKKKVFLDKILNCHNELSKLLETILVLQGKKIYIPTLRTAHSLFKEKENSSSDFTKIRDDIFLDTTRKNYKELNIISHEERKAFEDKRLQKEKSTQSRGDVEVFTGMNLYNEIVNVRNSKKEKRERFHEFEKFLSINFFENKTVDIVAEFNVYRRDADIENDDLILVLIGETTRKLHELGDGVQALIILMYKIFLADNDSIIYIDEPEINLHPGYQRLFLEQITRNPELTKKNLTYVIVTHSNHFLDLTLEKDNVSIYSFSALPEADNEKDKFMIRNVNAGDNQLLRDLGVNNSSVFLANSSIWVEGISDRNFIKAFLEAYCESSEDITMPREDIDFAFFEYAGGNLIHYDFRKSTSEGKEVQRLINSYALNNRIFLLSDVDNGKDAKHKTLEEIAADNENFVYKTTKPYREIENVLPNEVWEKVLLEFWNKNKIKDEEAKEKVQEEISQALTKVNSKKYSKEYIGEFFNALSLKDLNQIWEIATNGKHKTFKQKAKLSEIVLKKVRNKEITWQDFVQNETIVELTKSIYNFIKNR